MNSFKHFIIPISNHLTAYWVSADGVKDTVGQPHLLYYQYSKHHNLQPKSDDPNIVCAKQEIRPEDSGNYDLLTSLPNRLYSMMEDIRYVGEYDLYLLRLLEYGHSQNYILASKYHDNAFEYRLAKHDNDILLPKQYEHLNDLLYVNLYDIQPYNKYRKFIETESSCTKSAGF